MARSSKKEAILDTAETLFYKHGFHAVGIKRILEEAGVATMTMYYHFKSKEELIEEILLRREQHYFLTIDSKLNKHADARTYAHSLIDAHQAWLEESGKNGCLFLRAKQEYAESNEQIASISKAHKQKLMDKIEKDLSGITNEKECILYLSIIIEGMTSMIQLVDKEDVKHHAHQLVEGIFSSASN
ncbi:TetR/AcrR family transcriptional regulator [Paenalkalicoccus suaedae]|uniref:TetR/AcrR family transcriptional regulator n=1 Tax=Paenalkalicoccus suaedae TaxID=2592382 RepID=A0A859FBV9_9BACI|nr:TetR/AcrR family transcriptional regulator [Paenalkalicoccus suaedae]QKS70308.1 TetR/AcrR family transcriptional regulator [Paenalkalicoccus suaedae]